MPIQGTKQQLKGKVCRDLLIQMDLSCQPVDYIFTIDKYRGYLLAY